MNPRTSMVTLALGVIAAATLPAGSALAGTTPKPTPAATATLTTSPPPTPIKATTPEATQKPGHPAAEPAPTDEISAQHHIWTLQNAITGRFLDSYHDGSVYTLPGNGGNHQKWQRNGAQFRNLVTGRCLDSNYVGDVYALPCNGGNYQNWNYTYDGQIKNYQTGRCLDSDFSGNVYTLTCGNYENWHQKWWYSD